MLIIRYPIKYEQIQVAFVLVKVSIYFESSKIGQFWCESFWKFFADNFLFHANLLVSSEWNLVT